MKELELLTVPLISLKILKYFLYKNLNEKIIHPFEQLMLDKKIY